MRADSILFWFSYGCCLIPWTCLSNTWLTVLLQQHRNDPCTWALSEPMWPRLGSLASRNRDGHYSSGYWLRCPLRIDTWGGGRRKQTRKSETLSRTGGPTAALGAPELEWPFRLVSSWVDVDRTLLPHRSVTGRGPPGKGWGHEGDSYLQPLKGLTALLATKEQQFLSEGTSGQCIPVPTHAR